MDGQLYILSVGQAVAHATDDSLARFWATLEANEVHPLATCAHIKHESLIACESHESAEALVRKVREELQREASEVNIVPYDLTGTSSCILLAEPRYSTRLLNFVGWTESELCASLAELFSILSPAPGSVPFGPIVQSLNIEPLSGCYHNRAHRSHKHLTEGAHNAKTNAQSSDSSEDIEAKYHVRVELRLDETHEIGDDDEFVTKLAALGQKSSRMRQHFWYGSLQLQKQKTFLFYSKDDFTGSGLKDTVIEDPQSIQESFAPHVLATELSLLSSAINRLGYHQQLYIDGTNVEDEEKTLTRTPSQKKLNQHSALLTLSNVLDSIEKKTPMDNVIIIHLDKASLHKSAALRVQLRIDASELHPKSFLQRGAESFHRILSLSTIHTDIFHLIGHLPTDVEAVFDSVFSHSSSPSSPSELPSPSETQNTESSRDGKGAREHFELNTRTDSLSDHPQFLTGVFSALALNHCKIAKLEGQRLIKAFDVLITTTSPNAPEFVPRLAHGSLFAVRSASLCTPLPLYAITIISSRITSVCLRHLVEQTSGLFAGFNRVRQLSIASSSRLAFTNSKSPLRTHGNATEEEVDERNEVDCLELLVRLASSAPDQLKALRNTLLDVGLKNGADVSLQRDTFARRNRRVATFDMDSTLIQLECIDEMAVFCGVGPQVKLITHRAMSGELDFKGALRERVKLLQGALAEPLFKHVLAALFYTPHAKFMCHTLRALGFEMAVLSGGFYPIILTVKSHLKLQHARANSLEIDVQTGKLTGNLQEGAKIIDADAKERYLRKFCAHAHINPDLSLAVGDGANDLKMLASSGLGIAFLAKQTVQEKTDFRINQLTLSPVLSLLGLSRDDCITLLNEER